MVLVKKLSNLIWGVDMGGSNTVKITSGHGLTGAGKGHPPMAGVTGPGGTFVGTTTPQDIDRKVSDNNNTDKGKKVSGNSAVKPGMTGGMSRKGKGGVGPGGY